MFDHGGPEPDNYNAFDVDVDGDGDTVTVRRIGQLPEHADLVFTHRPTEELPEIAETARAIGATTLWRHSGVAPDGHAEPAACFVSESESNAGRKIAEAAGLTFIDDVYILDALHARSPAEPRASAG